MPIELSPEQQEERLKAASGERARSVLECLRSDAALRSLRTRVRESAAALMEQLAPQTPPLYLAEEGAVIRVGNTRVSLDTLMEAYQQGASAEEIVLAYPALNLPDVHAVIACYLGNRQLADEYLSRSREEADAIERVVREHSRQDGIRERLLARRAAKAATTKP